MTPMLTAVVWHFWLAVPLAASAILWVIATVLGYFMNVTRPPRPKTQTTVYTPVPREFEVDTALL